MKVQDEDDGEGGRFEFLVRVQ